METMENSKRILVVDDNEALRVVLSQTLAGEGHDVVEAASGEQALDVFKETSFDVVFTDIVMEEMSGIELLQEIKKIHSDTQVIVVTSYASLDTAVNALRSGAYDYISKPFEDPDLITAVANRAIDKLNLIDENKKLVEELKEKNLQLEEANILLKEQVVRDGLTGLYNHRFFQEHMATEVQLSLRHNRTFALLFLDVDYFKKYNDTHGHLAGDKLLRSLGEVICGRLRKSDFTARYGGEEFVVVLPETEKDHALYVAEDICRIIAEHPFPGRETQPMKKVTISIGVAAFPIDAQDKSSLLAYADMALYNAKNKGRNQVCLYAP